MVLALAGIFKFREPRLMTERTYRLLVGLSLLGILYLDFWPGMYALLTLLVFEAVLEVVCVSLPGYIVARHGMFNAEMQKFAANLNVMLFTPCLSMPSTA